MKILEKLKGISKKEVWNFISMVITSLFLGSLCSTFYKIFILNSFENTKVVISITLIGSIIYCISEIEEYFNPEIEEEK